MNDILDGLVAELRARGDVSQSDLQAALAIMRRALAAASKPGPGARTSPIERPEDAA